MHVNEMEVRAAEASVRVKEEFVDNSIDSDGAGVSRVYSNFAGIIDDSSSRMTSFDHIRDDDITAEVPCCSPITSTTSSSESSADSGFLTSSGQTERSPPTSPLVTPSTEKEGTPPGAFPSSDLKPRNLNLISCEDCGLICAGQSHYQVHIRSHTGERPFKCTICGVAFTQKGNLRRHHKIHSDEKPFQCPICSYRCRRRDALNGHMKIHSDHRPYRCAHCARSYKSRQSLKEHEQQCSYRKDDSPVSPSKSTKFRRISDSPKRSFSSPPPLQASKQNIFSTLSSRYVLPQNLMQLTAFSLNRTPASTSSSSGKRKASIPQKFTRHSDVSSSPIHEDSKSSPPMLPHTETKSSLASSPRFMPSIIASMMQHHLEDDTRTDEISEAPQNEAVDFSMKRTSAKQRSSKNRDSAAAEVNPGKSLNSNATTRHKEVQPVQAESPRGGEETEIKKEEGQVSPRCAVKRVGQSFPTIENEKLSGSARRKSPRYSNERAIASGDPAHYERMAHSEKAKAGFEHFARNYLGTSQCDDVRLFNNPLMSSLDASNFHVRNKNFDGIGKVTSRRKSGESSKFGLRIFATTGEDGGGAKEVKALYCPHCRCLFIDYVMFAIHAGCHGNRHPFECSVCGHLAANRYQFQSHLTRGEHLVTVANDDRESDLHEFTSRFAAMIRDDVMDDGAPSAKRSLLEKFPFAARAGVR